MARLYQIGNKEKPRDFWKAQGLRLLKDRNFSDAAAGILAEKLLALEIKNVICSGHGVAVFEKHQQKKTRSDVVH